MKKISFNEISDATLYCERFLYYRDLDIAFRKWSEKEIKQYSDYTEFERNLKIIKFFISEPYDLFSRNYIGLSSTDSVCGFAVSVSERLKTIIKKCNLSFIQ